MVIRVGDHEKIHSNKIFLLPIALVAGVLAALAVTVGISDFAKAVTNPPQTMWLASKTYTDRDPMLYAYVGPGESLLVNVNTAPDGAILEGPGGFVDTCDTVPCSWSGLMGEGIWRVTIPGGTGFATWRIEVSDGGGIIPGRAWANEHVQAQVANDSGTNDYTFWYKSEYGFLYQATYPEYNGINSIFRSDATGVRFNDTCVSAYTSIDIFGPYIDTDKSQTDLYECGEPYKIFFESPDPTMPATATQWDGTTTWLNPPVMMPNLQALNFTPSGSMTERSGTITYQIENFTGQFMILVDTNNDGNFNGPEDVVIPTFSADGSGSVTFDGLDGGGNPVPLTQDMSIRAVIDRAGEIHFTRWDVEGPAGGMEIVRLNGPGAPDTTLYWDDTKFQTENASRCGTLTPLLDGTGGVDSTGGVHGWDWDGCAQATVNDGINGPYGDGRTIDDWTFITLDEPLQLTVLAAADNNDDDDDDPIDPTDPTDPIDPAADDEQESTGGLASTGQGIGTATGVAITVVALSAVAILARTLWRRKQLVIRATGTRVR